MRMNGLLNRRRGERGFTLLELMVTMSIAGTLAAIGAGALFSWQRTSQHQGSAQAVVSELRQAAEQAVSEGRTYCVDFTPSRTYQLWRYACGTGGTTADGVRRTQSTRVTLEPSVTSPSPTPACPASHKCVYFYPRGTASPATVLVRSSARSKLYTVHVEGLTSRVYL